MVSPSTFRLRHYNIIISRVLFYSSSPFFTPGQVLSSVYILLTIPPTERTEVMDIKVFPDLIKESLSSCSLLQSLFVAFYNTSYFYLFIASQVLTLGLILDNVLHLSKG